MKRIGVRKFVVVIPILAICLLAFVFPFPIYFENALTLQTAQEFDIKIAFWRIVFEPVLGLFLYFNRSLYTLEELPLALLWVLVLYTMLSAFKVIKARTGRKKMILRATANLLLLIGICFTVFTMILFMPLPNNTIVNNSKDAVLVTTHAHTEFSHDGLISQEAMWKWHKRNGFDAFFITDHANHKKSLQFAQNQRKGNFPMTPLVMVGQEYSASNHMSLLGLKENFETKGMSDKTVIDLVHKQGGAVIINHWFDGKGEAKELYKNLGADGFEIENTGTDLYYDRDLFREIKKFCENNRLTMVGGLDFHGYGRACPIYNAFEIPGWKTMDASSKETAILEILKEGQQEKINVLMYKDRPHYNKNNLLFRPFVTLVTYFRTLEASQVLSWVFWLLLGQFLLNSKWQRWPSSRKSLPVLAIVMAIVPIGMAISYYFKGKGVIGYSDLYFEYSSLLGPIGVVFLANALAVWYCRTFNRRKTTS